MRGSVRDEESEQGKYKRRKQQDRKGNRVKSDISKKGWRVRPEWDLTAVSCLKCLNIAMEQEYVLHMLKADL